MGSSFDFCDMIEFLVLKHGINRALFSGIVNAINPPNILLSQKGDADQYSYLNKHIYF